MTYYVSLAYLDAILAPRILTFENAFRDIFAFVVVDQQLCIFLPLAFVALTKASILQERNPTDPILDQGSVADAKGNICHQLIEILCITNQA